MFCFSKKMPKCSKFNYKNIDSGNKQQCCNKEKQQDSLETHKDVFVLFEKMFKKFKKRRPKGNWKNKKQKEPSKNQENIRN